MVHTIDSPVQMCKTGADPWFQSVNYIELIIYSVIDAGIIGHRGDTKWLLQIIDEHLRKRLRTSNVVERLNREIRRRTKVASMFPNEASCLRLVTAVVMEISDDWVASDRCWLSLKED